MASLEKRCSLGLDVGGTRIKAIALETPDRVLAEFETDSRASEGPTKVRETLNDCVKTFKNKGIDFSGIGIGCAGSVDPIAGIVRNSPNFSSWKDIPLRNWIQQDTGLPVQIENDANCAVLAEWKIGSGQGGKNVVLLTLGTGIGGGLVLNGQLFHGSTGTAGELGHMSIFANGIECACGNRGCFEKYCSATAVRANSGGVSAREVFKHPESNPQFRKTLEEFLANFKTGLVSVANMFDPDFILLGGAVAEGVGNYLEEIQHWVSTHAFPAVGAHTKIKLTKYKNLSGALGAAFLTI